ncbi:MAG: hypothetical protein V4812_00885 [Pseudomonadota bacterium]
MNVLNPTFTVSAISLALLVAGAYVRADDNPAATVSIKAAPNAGQSHTLQVQLDQQGGWSIVPSSTVKMRFEFSHHWSIKPNSDTWARIYVGEAKIPKGGENYFDAKQMFDLSKNQILATSGSINANLPFNLLVADGIPGTNISGYCDFEKSNRLSQGKTLNAVLRQGFNVKLNVPLRLSGSYSLGGGPNTSRPASNHQYHLWNNTAPVTIQCLGNPAIADKVAPPKGPEELVAAFRVNSVDLVALPYPASTVCPTEITLKATVKGVGGGEIKYWLEALNGQDAAVQQASTLPGKPGEPSERVIMQKVSLKPDPLQKPQGIDSLKANTQGSLVKRSYRFNVLTPNKLQSQKVDLEVLCTSTLNVGLGAHGNSVKTSPPPQPPKPELPLQAVPVEPQPPKPELQLQAAPVQPPKPELQLQAAPVQPPKPELQLQAAPVQPSMPELQLQAAPVQPPQPELQLRAPQTQPVRPQPMRLQGIQPQPPKRVGTLQPQQP